MGFVFLNFKDAIPLFFLLNYYAIIVLSTQLCEIIRIFSPYFKRERLLSIKGLILSTLSLNSEYS